MLSPVELHPFFLLSLNSFVHEPLADDIFISQGFDEFMNIVLDDAAEVYVKDAKPRREVGAHSQNSVHLSRC